MAEEEEKKEVTTETEESSEGQQASGGQKIMCFVSKEMVPINQTVELEYMPGKKVRVLPRFVKYETEESVL
jgi:hypothetical protein